MSYWKILSESAENGGRDHGDKSWQAEDLLSGRAVIRGIPQGDGGFFGFLSGKCLWQIFCHRQVSIPAGRRKPWEAESERQGKILKVNSEFFKRQTPAGRTQTEQKIPEQNKTKGLER